MAVADTMTAMHVLGPEIEGLPISAARAIISNGRPRGGSGNTVHRPPARSALSSGCKVGLKAIFRSMAILGFCWMTRHMGPQEYGGILRVDLEAKRLPGEDDFVDRDRAAFPDAPPPMPFHKAFALYPFAVFFVGIASRALAGNAADSNAAALAPLEERFAIRALEIAEKRRHGI